MIKEKRKPNIRFPGFEDDWEQRKLGELGEIITGNTPPTANGELYASQGIPWITPTDINSLVMDSSLKCLSSEGEKVARLVPEGSILCTCIASIGKNTLVSVKSSFNQQINALVPRLELYDSYFLLTDSFNWSKKMNSMAGTQTIAIVNKTEFSKITTSIPKLEEQQKIGSFFKKIDKTITLHQRKLDDLKELKSGLLQKMFPQKGEKVPQVRFPGFTGDWEQRKLSDIAQITAGGTPSTSEPDYWDGKVDWYSPSEIGTATYATGSERKITKLGVEKSSAKILPADRTILFTSRASIGDMAILKKDGCTNQGFQSLVLNEGIDTYFVYSSGFRIKEYALKNAAGSTFLEISGKQLGKMDFSIPSPEEQKEIGDFFKNLDETITLHQQKIDDLNQLKSGLLQKMFP